MSQNEQHEHSIILEQQTSSLYVQNTGHQQCRPGASWGPGIRKYFLLHHVVAGKGTYICRGHSYELSAGDTFLIFPNAPVHYYADCGEPWEYLWVGFGGPEAENLVAKTDFYPDEPVYYGRDSDEVRTLLSAIYNSRGVHIWEALEMTSRLYALLAFLVRTARRQENQQLYNGDCAQLAAAYIINHYEEPLTVEALADYVSVSHSSLYRRFVKRYQISPKRFLLEYRIERACAMLTDTSCSVQEISNSVGFEDPYYFSRAFKELKGISPRQYAARSRRK